MRGRLCKSCKSLLSSSKILRGQRERELEKDKIAQVEKDREVELARIAAEKDKIAQAEKDREVELVKIAADREIEMARIERQAEKYRESKLAQIEGDKEAQGTVNGKKVIALRDTGCTGCVVRTSLVSSDQLLGKESDVTLIDESTQRYPLAMVEIDCPFFTGKTEAL